MFAALSGRTVDWVRYRHEASEIACGASGTQSRVCAYALLKEAQARTVLDPVDKTSQTILKNLFSSSTAGLEELQVAVLSELSDVAHACGDLGRGGEGIEPALTLGLQNTLGVPYLDAACCGPLPKQ